MQYFSKSVKASGSGRESRPTAEDSDEDEAMVEAGASDCGSFDDSSVDIAFRTAGDDTPGLLSQHGLLGDVDEGSSTLPPFTEAAAAAFAGQPPPGLIQPYLP